jgi:hypothetical protein
VICIYKNSNKISFILGSGEGILNEEGLGEKCNKYGKKMVSIFTVRV